MDFSEKWGTDVDAAVQLALADLKLTIDEVNVTVLEEPSRGFFGIGSKLAKVRVEKKKPEKKEPVKVEKKVEKKIEKKVEKTVQTKQEITVAKEQSKKEKKEAHKKEAPKKKKVETFEPAQVKEPEANLTDCDDHVALTFLNEVTKEMGLDLDIKCKIGEDTVYLDIQGKDSGTIIGKRGQTLDAIQYLTSLVVNKENGKYQRVVVDAESYRAKREKTLEALAYRLANKVTKSRRSVKLEPMNPYERKVIHATLQNHPSVTTRSEGQDPYRRVIIELK